MLQRSFVHIPGIGQATEQKLWQRGIRSWETLHQSATEVFKLTRADAVRRALDESLSAYARRDLAYFSSSLPRDQLWRLLPEVSLDEIAFLDIETTGLGFPPASHSTTISFYLGGQVYQEYEPGPKLELIRDVLSRCSMIATFFGQAFDVPFLEREFGIPFNKPHLDLCFWLRRLGCTGGLKRVQKLFPSIPTRTSLDIDGYDAVRLWRLHVKGVPGALETLLAYNAEDTVVLKALLVEAWRLELARHPDFGLEPLPSRDWPAIPTRVWPEVYG